MTPEEKLLEIKNTLRIHNELAQSQCQWLIYRVEFLTKLAEELAEALEKIVFDRGVGAAVANAQNYSISREALASYRKALTEINAIERGENDPRT